MPKTLITPNIKTVKKGNKTHVVCGSKTVGKVAKAHPAMSGLAMPVNAVVGAKAGMATTTGTKPKAKKKKK